MPATDPTPSEFSRVAAAAVEQVRQWLREPGGTQTSGARRLAELLGEPGGLDFAVQFIDGVARPRDLRVAGDTLSRLMRRIPRSLPALFRAALWLGGQFGPVLPWAVVPIARLVLRRLVGHLVVDNSPGSLGSALARLRTPVPGTTVPSRLNLNLLGEAVLGEDEAAKRLAGIRTLLERPDVDYVSIKVSNVVSNLSMWAFDDAVNTVVQRLTPLYELAASGGETSVTPGRTKFINLDMEEYRDLDLTIAVFKRLLSNPRLRSLEAGIVLQAYLPDSLDALQDLTEWAQTRRAAGGAPIKVRIVKGANLAMEKVDAALHGWPLATWGSKLDTDVNYKRLLDWALTPEHTAAVHIGVAGHNLFDVAFAWLLAGERGVRDRVDVEMLLGMVTDAVARAVGRLTLYTPVVHPREFDVAIAYLVRRLEENGSPENFMSAMFSLRNSPELFARERDRFLDAVEVYERSRGELILAPLPNRRQDRTREWQDENATALFHPRVDPVDPAGQAKRDAGLTGAVLGLPEQTAWNLAREELFAPPKPATWQARGGRASFRNAADTDPSLRANRVWAKRILGRVRGSDLGMAAVVAAHIGDPAKLERLIGAVRAAGVRWAQAPGSERADVLELAGLALSANRELLIEVMAAETGKTIAEADAEVSEAADFAHYYAALARELDTVQGATFVPSALIVVTPPWNFPVSIPAGGVLSALAAGSGVIIKPAPQAKRCAAVLVDVLHRAGVPRDALALVDVDEEPNAAGISLGEALISDPRVDRVILTGSYETAKLFRSWRPELQLLAETSGKNAIIVTPNADYDLAVADLVHSAFSNAGQKCSAASLAILVGSVADDERFRHQLVDAVRSLHVGPPTDPASQVGPLIAPPTGSLRWALTELDQGEKWLVEPRQLDRHRLWSPGVKVGVEPGSRTHLVEFFGPVLGIMHAKDLDEAISLQNAVDYGLTAGLHSLDAGEIARWVDSVQAGNLYVNRHITGAIVQRQPFGGWKRSSVGTTVKAGGPNTLLPLGSWVTEPGEQGHSLHLRGLDRDVQQLIEAGEPAMSFDEFDVVRRSALSDAIAYATEYGAVTDAAAIGVERNLFRYRATPVGVRLGAGGTIAELIRVLAAASVSRAPFDVSTALPLPAGVTAWLDAHGVPVRIEDDEVWLGRLTFAEVEVDPGAARPGLRAASTIHRIRLIGGNGLAVDRALGDNIDVAVYDAPVTASGRVELLPFFREQAISITNHRFGSPSHLTDGLLG